MTVDARYTEADHEFRKDDVYARAKYDITLRWLGPAVRPTTLYHVGCGAGVFNHMAVAAGYDVVAFEPDQQAFAMAQQTRPSERCTLHPLALGVVPGRQVADVLVMHDVLEHIADEQGAVDALHRIVRDDGRLILSVPALPSLFGHHDRHLGHHRRYTRRTLDRALRRHFRIVRMRYFGAAFLPVALTYSRWLDRPYPTARVGGRRSLLSSALEAACKLESRVPAPLGTSLVCEATPLSP